MESDWKYFLEDTNNIYLMYGDYLENAQIPEGTNITIDEYIVKALSNREDLINYLKGETATYISTWDTINDGVKTAVKARLIANGASEENATTAVSGVATKGAPTLEQWMSSYNENYGTKLGAQNFASTGQTYYNSTSVTSVGTSTTTTSATGYLYTRDNTESQIKWETFLPEGYMNQQAGYPGSGNSNMYYPHTSEVSASSTTTNGYWLARSFGQQL